MNDDLDDPRPLYVQVANELRAGIQRGDYEVGAKLPTYAEIGARFGVSHMTVKQAISVLKKERTVTARQGLGIFVRTADVNISPTGDLDELRSRIQELEQRVHAIETRVRGGKKP